MADLVGQGLGSAKGYSSPLSSLPSSPTSTPESLKQNLPVSLFSAELFPFFSSLSSGVFGFHRMFGTEMCRRVSISFI
jgi:hypothetical protein